jgi:serine/threonine protein kinase
VLVTPEGRVVILDFGMIAELLPLHPGEARYESGGTPAYMAPEEASGTTPSEAGDWYSVGVTFYEALTGTIPFAGTVTDLIVHKSTIDPPAPAEVDPDVPADLSAICMALLCRDPARRLSGPAALHVFAPDAAGSGTAPVPIRATPFVGRDAQLHVLNEALGTVIKGSAAAVSVSGPSGIGKSALVRYFLGQIADPQSVVVLSGRCYENESVPYKALDGVVDDLSRHLASICARTSRVCCRPMCRR